MPHATPPLDRATVLAHADAIVDAARQFRRLATDLVARLIKRLDIEHTAGVTYWKDEPGPQSDRLDRDWTYNFHGFECCFRHRRTGQTLDVRLEFAPEFGALDPYFFAVFVRTTTGLEHVARLFGNDFADPALAIEVLAAEGRLAAIESFDLDAPGRGWFAP